ncbi:TonB-dependent receptor [Asticcacaulis excentricus]|uniref:TonB-dependent receptor n=1 Tax=Asticcacaulis excentricus (strain ATCC 15261 / DSM 4724 / KCTC 12464 / NCIMB 9791 / VKM B-1370 / CB 48) TaxID=573065 RepID=E8RPA6_ASTEC|nr:TonB-dependent receptor [Asticcacaulis excentricus]ADU11952.1 TonB-dependent receptor [Asticcacaulis excentricus CB 48]
MKAFQHRAPLYLKSAVSTVALASLVWGTCHSAMAQEAATGSDTGASSEAKEIVVVGVRKSLQSAQQIKKNADTVVDSITANDIGSFPDKSVAEALQRVAGITVNRFAATGDTAHFSAEPSGVIVRGLQQVRSEFNGRDIFSADSNRGLSWSDVSPELMGGIDVYKNQTADLIEGGIAGTVSLRTRLPFDQKGRLLAATAEYTYGDLAKTGTEGVSGIFSDRWDVGSGEFGIMLNVAHSEVVTNSQGIKYGRIGKVSNASNWGSSDTLYIPSSIAVSDNTYNRVRDGGSFAVQWQNNEHTMLATFQYNLSRKHETWEEYVMTASSGVSTYGKDYDYVSTDASEVQCLQGTTCTFDDSGFLSSGTLVSGTVWKGSVSKADGSDLFSYDWSGAGQLGTDFTTTSRYSDSVNETQDASFNFKWEPTSQLKLNFDLQYIKATQTNYDITADLATYANATWDLTGDIPHFNVSSPTNINVTSGGITDPSNYRLNDLMDHITDSDGKELAVRADAEYVFDSPWLRSLKFGARYADREQTVRWTTYNWKSVVNSWSSYSADDYFITGSTFPDSKAYATKAFDSEFFGGGITNASSAVFFNMDYLKNQSLMAEMFGKDSYNPGGSNAWESVCDRDDLVEGCFKAAEIARVSETTKALYAVVKFGGNDATIFNGITVSGNLGLRYVETHNRSSGGVNYSSGVSYSTSATETLADGTVIPSVTYYISSDDRLFMTSSDEIYTASTTHHNLLPSFNVRFGLTDEWFVRFAASKALSRPDIGNLKYYKTVSVTTPTSSELSCGSGFTCDANGQIVSTNLTYTAQANNPFLKPMTADQLDLTMENYFSSTGSFTFNLFYKKFNDYIQYGKWYQNFTNNGVTRSVEVSGPVNGDGASIKGFEVAYQRFFDFLPAPFNGLGIQANYTHIKNSGITSTGVAVNSGDGSSGQSGGGTTKSANTFNDLPLEGMSDDTVNLVGMYERGKWSARVAYNWRSKYLVTAQDCCVAYPVWQRAAGYLDARLAYRINANVELSVEGTNLLNTRTELMQQVEGATDSNPDTERKLVDYAWYQNDRRLQATIRMKF